MRADYNIVVSYSDLEDNSGVDEPVSLQEMKDFIRLEGWAGVDSTSDFNFDDDLISLLITAARKYIEQMANVSLIEHEYEVILTNGAGRIELPFSPIGEISSVKNHLGTEETFKTSGNDRKFLVCPCGHDMKVSYSTTAIKHPGAVYDLKVLVQAMYNMHCNEPSKVLDNVSLFLLSYSRQPAIA